MVLPCLLGGFGGGITGLGTLGRSLGQGGGERRETATRATTARKTTTAATKTSAAKKPAAAKKATAKKRA